MRAKQLLNQFRDFYHQNNQLVIGAIQETETNFTCLTVKGSKEEHHLTPVNRNEWPYLFCGEILTDLRKLPQLMQRSEYRNTHIL